MKRWWIAGLCVLLGVLCGCAQMTRAETVVSQPNPGADVAQARDEEDKQLEGRQIGVDQCYDFVFRSVVFRYYPYQEFASLDELRRVFPDTALPAEMDGCSLLSARLMSLDYNDMAVEMLPSSDKVGQVYALPPRVEPIQYAWLTYRADDGRRILVRVADGDHLPAVTQELFQYDGQPCVLSDQDSRDESGALYSVTLLAADGYAYTVSRGVDGPEMDGKTSTLAQSLTLEEARALLEKIPFDAFSLKP
ncbi:MAG: hypothetical protein PHO66_01930 [Eubacteriales bacterium]|nr:hypothetical protein [Eubacteriales bacterium]